VNKGLPSHNRTVSQVVIVQPADERRTFPSSDLKQPDFGWNEYVPAAFVRACFDQYINSSHMYWTDELRRKMMNKADTHFKVVAALALLLALLSATAGNALQAVRYSTKDCTGPADPPSDVPVEINACLSVLKKSDDKVTILVKKRKVEITSIAIYCFDSKFAYGTHPSETKCPSKRRPLSQLCIPDEDGRHSVKLQCGPQPCDSDGHLSKGLCNARIKGCRNSRPMKWYVLQKNAPVVPTQSTN
jgi:hypothetical protein